MKKYMWITLAILAVFSVCTFQVKISSAQAEHHTENEVNVMDFGARPDDLADDSQAIRRAIEELRNSKKTFLYFPKGTYWVSQDALGTTENWLFPILSNKTYYGEVGATLEVPASSESGSIVIFQGSDVTNFTLKGLRFTSKKKNGAVSAVSLTRANNTRIEGNTFENLVWYRSDPRFKSPQPFGTTIQFMAGRNNKTPSENNYVVNNTFIRAGAFHVRLTTPWEVEQEELSATGETRHTYISKNYFEGSDYSAIELAGPNTHHITIDGNTFKNTNGPAIDVDKGAHHNTITNNTITGVNKTDMYDAGYMAGIDLSITYYHGKKGKVVYPSHHNRIEGNMVFTNSLAKGIRLQGSYNNIIRKNKISAQTYGISLQPSHSHGSHDVDIRDNVISAGINGLFLFPTKPIDIAKSGFEKIEVANNHIASEHIGIYIADEGGNTPFIKNKGKKDITIKKNVITSAKKQSIFVYGVDRLTITDNVLSQKTDWMGAIYLIGTENSVISGNSIKGNYRFVNLKQASDVVIEENDFDGKRSSAIPLIEIVDSRNIFSDVDTSK